MYSDMNIEHYIDNIVNNIHWFTRKNLVTLVEITILGSGASLLSPDRVLAGLMVEIADNPLIFDIGPGVLHRLSCSLPELTRIRHVFLSHFHVDHCSDLPGLMQSMWLMGYKNSLNVYGPEHIENAFKGISLIFPYLIPKLPLKLYVTKPGFQAKTQDWTVTAFPVDHGDMEAYGFLIEAEGKRVVYSGDTRPCAETLKQAKGADLLIHECSLPDRMKDQAPNHTTPGELGALAAQAEVKTLVITHLYPELLKDLSEALSSIRRSYSGKVIVPRDTQVITI
jgi:ribonuclease BN (tRNA processing enzyme)